MSGGIDSSMSAYLLQQQEYEVVGITFNTHSPMSSEESVSFISEAKKLADKLQIKHYTIDVYDDFKRSVIDYFVDEYMEGRTPNPCIRCNETIKWKLLYEESERLQCDYISTGHYVSLVKNDNYYHIKKGLDPKKDQSYFLWNLPQYILKRCIFPLGTLLKSEVREKAQELGYNQLADKKESMGVCFLQGQNYRDFLLSLKADKLKSLANGTVKNSNGETVGSHDGIPLYTIGQKRGLNLNRNEGEYVAELHPEKNLIITAPKTKLHSSTLIINDYIFNNPSFLDTKRNVDIRIRGLDAVPPTPGTIEIVNNKLIVHFSVPVWAITPGQSIVFYKDTNIVIGGGIADDVKYDA